MQFNNDVNNLVLAELLSSPDFDDYVGDLTIVRHFVPWSVSPAYSNFGFDLGTGAGHCSIAWNDATTTDLVEGAVAASAPFRTIIVGKSTYRFGCAFDSWSYVSSSAFGNRTITHEGGHMLGELYDEAASAALLNTNYVTDNGQLDERNCSTKASPHWTPWMLPGVTNPLACALYGHAISTHLPRVSWAGPHVNLCEVCRRSLTDEMRYLKKQAEQPIPPVTPTPTPPTSLRIKGAGLFLQPTQPTQPTQPPPPRPGEQPMVRLVIGITRASNALTVRRATNVTGRYIPDYRRLGRIAYEVSEGGKPLAYGFLRGDPFQVRDYRGGSPQHEINQAGQRQLHRVDPWRNRAANLRGQPQSRVERVSRGSKRHGSRHPAAGVSGTEGQEVGNDVVAARAGRAEEDADVAARLDAHSRPV